MDRYTNQDGSDFQPGTVNLDLIFTASTAGAVPSSFTRAEGVDTVTKSSNDYIVALQDSYVQVLNWTVNVVQATYNASTGACHGNVTAISVTDDTPTVTLSFYNAAGTAVALAIGDELHVTLRLQRQEPI